MTLDGRTIFISGASRGIGLAIALRAARDGANVALFAKTGEPHPKLEGTVFSAAQQIEQAGGQAPPIVGDIRDEARVEAAVAEAVELYADAAHAVLTRDSRQCTGSTYLCEDVLADEGVTDMSPYAYVEGAEPQVDLFVDHV